MRDLVFAIIFLFISLVNGYLFTQNPTIIAFVLQIVYFVLALVYTFKWNLSDGK